MAATSKGQSTVSVPEWTIKEQLVLASAVQRSGDQNWVSVSRSIKPLVEDVRPTDYFSQKNCAQQYAAMLDKVTTPHKRKKRISEGSSEGVETTEQQIVRGLSEKRISELNESLYDMKQEYFALMKEVELLEKGELDHKVPEMWEQLQSTDTTTKDTKPAVDNAVKNKSSSSTKLQDPPKLALSKASLPQSLDTSQSSPNLALVVKDSSPTFKQSNEATLRAVVKMETNLTPSVVQPPNRNIDMGVTVKKELMPGTPTLTDFESSLVRLPSVSDEKILSPMQTPLPSTGQPLSADLHIIVQQRNQAVDNLIANSVGEKTEFKGTLSTGVATTSELLSRGATVDLTNNVSISTSVSQSIVLSQPKVLSPLHTKQPLVVSTTSLSLPASIKTSVLPFLSKPNVPVTALVTQSLTTKLTPPQPTSASVSMTVLQPATHRDISHVQDSTIPTSVQLSRPVLGSKSVPIMAYLSKSHNMPTSLPKGGVLQSLVSSPNPSLVGSVKPLPPTVENKPPVKMVTQINPIASTLSLVPNVQLSKTVVSPPVTFKPGNTQAFPITPPVTSHLTTSMIQPNTAALQSRLVASTPITTTSPSWTVIKTQDTIGNESPTVSNKDNPLSLIKSEPTFPQLTSKPLAPLVNYGVSGLEVVKDNGAVVKTSEVKKLVSPTKLAAEKSAEPEKVKALSVRGMLEGSSSLLAQVRSTPITSEPEQRRSPSSPAKIEEKNTPVKMDPEPKQPDLPSEVTTPISSPPSLPGSAMHGPPTSTPSILMEALEGETEEDTPTKVRRGRTGLKRTLLTRSRKRKADDDGPSVESTDTEEDGFSSQATSAVPSPAPSQCSEMDADALRAHKQWKKGIMIVWRHAAQHKFANFFLHPVREEDAPGYKDIILSPIDLSTIKRKVESGLIRNDIEFQRDMLLMFQNAFMYNSSDHEVYQIAQDMKTDVMENLQTYLATQAQLQLVEDPVPAKTLRGRRGDRDQSLDESVFSPATKKRRTRADD